jgi:hypothetical protein
MQKSRTCYVAVVVITAAAIIRTISNSFQKLAAILDSFKFNRKAAPMPTSGDNNVYIAWVV